MADHPRGYTIHLNAQQAATILLGLGQLKLAQGIEAFDAVRDQMRAQDAAAVKAGAAPSDQPG